MVEARGLAGDRRSVDEPSRLAVQRVGDFEIEPHRRIPGSHLPGPRR